MRTATLCLVMLLYSCVSFAQDKRHVTAIRSLEAIEIDGQLNEPSWSLTDPVSDFTELKPNPGKYSEHQCCVKVLYDDTGIYIGAELEDGNITRLGTELFERDGLSDSRKIDWFGVVIDCYQNGINGYGFVVSASGVQTDIKFAGDDDDSGWDAVWDSDIAYQDGGWTCEIKIPYSALRFPETEEQQWGIQFGRRSHQRQEESWWNPVDPAIDGLLPQTGILTGVREIKPPARLSATPFFAVYAENFSQPGSNTRSSWGSSYNGGMDVKYGISDAYTMDMTLIPDFGQVQSDNEVLNLSPFEIAFNENRQFFTEGTELFSKADLFYSRRVGGTPYYFDQIYEGLQGDERIDDIRGDSKLINATKISGRSKGGTGLGFFNAISPRDHATIENMISGQKHEVLLQPWTNYNVMVIDQNLKNNSAIALVNTNVWREGQARDANVTGLQVDLRDHKNIYGFFGSGSVSQQVESNGQENGYRYSFGFERISGKWNYGISHYLVNDTYDNNDLGFISTNNQKSWSMQMSFEQHNPFGPFLKAGIGWNAQISSLFKFPEASEVQQYRPNLLTSGGFEIWTFATFKNYINVNFWVYTQPGSGYDYFEPRVPGRFFTYPAFHNYGVNINSDPRKKLQAGINMRFNKFHEKDKYQLGSGGYLSYRLNDHFSFRYDYQRLYMNLDRGYITEIGDDVVFGAREFRDITQYLQADYSFNPKMSLSFRLRHNWTRVHYTHFYTLQLDGGITDRTYNENEDINFNAWTIDASYRWRFSPGSDLFVVWKNAIFGYNQDSAISFSENLSQLFHNPQSNSFSVKAIYYLDFQRL